MNLIIYYFYDEFFHFTGIHPKAGTQGKTFSVFPLSISPENAAGGGLWVMVWVWSSPGHPSPKLGWRQGWAWIHPELCSSHQDGGSSLTEQKKEEELKFWAGDRQNRFTGIPSIECNSRFGRPTEAEPDHKI